MASTAAQTPNLPSPKRKRSIVALPSRTRLRPSTHQTSEASAEAYSIRNGKNEDIRQRFQDLKIAPSTTSSKDLAGLRKVVADSDDERIGLVTPPSPGAASEDWGHQKTTAEKHSLPGGLGTQDDEGAQEEEEIMATPPYSPLGPASKPRSQCVDVQASTKVHKEVNSFASSTSQPISCPLADPKQIPLPTSPSPSPRKGRRSPAKPSPDLFWSFSEITGYLPSSAKTDPFDDGTGINGVGFAPTRAEAARRAKKRRDAVAEWKKREQREDRARRAREKEDKVRRAEARVRAIVEDSETDELGMEVKAANREAKKKVRFAPQSAGKVKKKSDRL